MCQIAMAMSGIEIDIINDRLACLEESERRNGRRLDLLVEYVQGRIQAMEEYMTEMNGMLLKMSEVVDSLEREHTGAECRKKRPAKRSRTTWVE